MLLQCNIVKSTKKNIPQHSCSYDMSENLRKTVFNSKNCLKASLAPAESSQDCRVEQWCCYEDTKIFAQVTQSKVAFQK